MAESFEKCDRFFRELKKSLPEMTREIAADFDRALALFYDLTSAVDQADARSQLRGLVEDLASRLRVVEEFSENRGGRSTD